MQITKNHAEHKMIAGALVLLIGLIGVVLVLVPKMRTAVPSNPATPEIVSTATTTILASSTKKVVRSPLTPDQNGRIGVYRITRGAVYLIEPDGVSEHPIDGADPDTFHVIVFDENNIHLRSNPTYPFAYAKDKNSVYVGGKPLAQADPATFKIISPGTYYSRDSDTVFVVDQGVRPIEGADPESFVALTEPSTNPCGSGLYAKDATRVYAGANVIVDADPASFVVMRLGYARDSVHVYNHTELQINADPATFEPPTCAEALKGY